MAGEVGLAAMDVDKFIVNFFADMEIRHDPSRIRLASMICCCSSTAQPVQRPIQNLVSLLHHDSGGIDVMFWSLEMQL